MPGIPGMLVAFVPIGAKVMTVRVSPDPPGFPGSTPHAVVRHAPVAAARSRRDKGVARRHLVMSHDHSATGVTER
ncbi:hypothetical protein GCM10010302_46780 [Streptomyces polychromogenes]|uniref:Uncharacterized protein n=1 Tax=Streptomyces polychromogenes TaxID=67342 RepID=A0ABN0VII2_9ACTN